MDPDRTTTTGDSDNVPIYKVFQMASAEPTTMAKETIDKIIFNLNECYFSEFHVFELFHVSMNNIHFYY